MKRWTLLGAAMLVVGLVSGAALAGSAGADSPAMLLSKRLMPEPVYKDLLHQMSDGIIQGAKNSGQTLPKDFQKKMEAVVAEALPYQELLQFNADIYSKRFSDQEIGDIIAFYKTPTGTKLAKELPGITRDAGVKIGGLLPQRMPALMKKYGLAN